MKNKSPILKIAVLANCQAFPIKMLLSKSIEIVFSEVPPIYTILGNHAEIKKVYDDLEYCDFIISQPLINNEFYELSVSNLKNVYSDKLIVIPVVFYQGEHPEMFYLKDETGSSIKSFISDYFDWNILLSYFNGFSIEFTVSLISKHDLYDDNILEKIKLYSLNNLREKEKDCDVIISDFIESNKENPNGLFWTINHPKNVVLFKLVERIIKKIVDQDIKFSIDNREYLDNVVVPRYQIGITDENIVYKFKGQSYTRVEVVKAYYNFFDKLGNELLQRNINSAKKISCFSSFIDKIDTYIKNEGSKYKKSKEINRFNQK